MACKPKNKMSPAERAKQFLPFAALHGLNEALMNKMKEIEMLAETGKLGYNEIFLKKK